MKLPKMKVPLFNCGNIIFCRSKEEFDFFCQSVDAEKPDIDSMNGLSSVYIHHKNHHRLFVIALFNNKLSTLAHEISHTAFRICNEVGVEVREGQANETFCYLVSNIMAFAEKHLKKPA